MASHLRNPYDFVPFEGNRRSATKSPPQDRIQPGLLTGTVHCTLSVLTPLFVWSGADQPYQSGKRTKYLPHWGDAQRPVIPASSLKGMLRSMVETVSDSCMGALSDKHSGIPLAGTSRIPNGYSPCTTLDHLCPACAIFGMVESESSAVRKEKQALSGRLWPTAATLAGGRAYRPQSIAVPARLSVNKETGSEKIMPLGNPKPAHELFYFANRRALGRKFYYRTTQWQAILEHYKALYQAALRNAYAAIELDAIRMGTTFTFDVHFLNLHRSELELLLYALVLEPDMCHHLGYGKAYGLGSLQIAVNAIHFDNTPTVSSQQRYLTYATAAATPMTQTLADYPDLADHVWNRGPKAAQAHTVLKEILRWPREEQFAYPDRDWFKRPEDGKTKTLATYQKEATAPADAPPQPTPPVPGQGPRPTRPTSSAQPAKAAPKLPYQVGENRWRSRVKSFNDASGYGFISGPGAKDLYVHYTAIQASHQRLLGNQLVEFSIGQGSKGPVAVDVVIIQEGK